MNAEYIIEEYKHLAIKELELANNIVNKDPIYVSSDKSDISKESKEALSELLKSYCKKVAYIYNHMYSGNSEKLHECRTILNHTVSEKRLIMFTETVMTKEIVEPLIEGTDIKLNIWRVLGADKLDMTAMLKAAGALGL